MKYKKGDKVWASVRIMGWDGTPRTEWRKAKIVFVGERECLVKIRGIGVRGRSDNQLVAR